MSTPTSDKQTEIIISRGGPIKVIGNFTVTDVNGNKLDVNFTNEIYLCACGRSKNKPLCDGSHKNLLNK